MAKEPKTLTHSEEIKGVSKKIHIDSGGNESRSAVAGETEFRMLFASGDMIVVNRGDLPETVWDAAGWHGLAQKLGDSYAGQKESGDDPYENASAMLEQLVAGNWVTESKATGPRIGLLVEAVVAAKIKAGKEVGPQEEADIAERMKDKEHAKRAKANPAVAAEYERLVAERAAARYKAAAEKAKGTDAAGLDDI